MNNHVTGSREPFDDPAAQTGTVNIFMLIHYFSSKNNMSRNRMLELMEYGLP